MKSLNANWEFWWRNGQVLWPRAVVSISGAPIYTHLYAFILMPIGSFGVWSKGQVLCPGASNPRSLGSHALVMAAVDLGTEFHEYHFLGQTQFGKVGTAWSLNTIPFNTFCFKMPKIFTLCDNNNNKTSFDSQIPIFFKAIPVWWTNQKDLIKPTMTMTKWPMTKNIEF